MKTAQYYRFLALEEKEDMVMRILRATLSASQMKEQLDAYNERIEEDMKRGWLEEEPKKEREKYLKIYPDESLNWMIVAFDAQCLWEGHISEMEEGDRLVVEVVEMTKEEVDLLPEFEGW